MPAMPAVAATRRASSQGGFHYKAVASFGPIATGTQTLIAWRFDAHRGLWRELARSGAVALREPSRLAGVRTGQTQDFFSEAGVQTNMQRHGGCQQSLCNTNEAGPFERSFNLRDRHARRTERKPRL